MKAILLWLISFFKSPKERGLEAKVEEQKKKLKEIENEDIDNDDISDYLQ